MATLILTTVGSFIGGPIGVALGGLLGNALDRQLLKPKGRQGPRLTELNVQASSYGQPIPRLYGTMRVAGTVVWSTDLKETRNKSGGGKGRPSTTTYSYSASFAVLLSGRAIQSVGRIWADGKLLRGGAGDLKVGTGFRIHLGGEDQAVDPLIAAAEGIDAAPALRGQAYAVFEDLQLADYGNRIPSLTFEVSADPGPVAVGAIAAELGVDVDDAGTLLDGFSAYGDSKRGVLETLAEIDGAWFADVNGAIRMRAGPGATIELTDMGAGADKIGARGVRSLSSGNAVPKQVAIAHYDPARDYQAGLQRARRPGSGVRQGLREQRIELPAALSAGAARTLATAALARAEVGRERRTLSLVTTALNVAPGSRVRVAGEVGLWRVERWVLERMVVRVELVRIAPGTLPVAATPGRVNPAPDTVHGPTILHAFEIPALDDVGLSAPRIMVAAAGGPGWRQAALLLSLDGGGRWNPAGGVTVPAVLGEIAVAPTAAGSALFDLAGSLEVELAHDGMELADADDRALDQGANLALVGDELLQFGRAARIAPGRWRLSRLLRGRRGTEWATGQQVVGDRFVLIEADALVALDLSLAAIGTEVKLMASGVGDLDGPVEAALTISGTSVAPPAPVALGWMPEAGGGATLRWARRSRAGWLWRDGGDVPLAEEAESYRVELPDRTVSVTVPELAFSAAERAAGPLTVHVRQLGSYAESRAATITIPGI